MANQITKYTNGTFEDPQGTWDEAYGPGTTAQVQDTVVFYQGLASVRMTTAAIQNPAFNFGTAQLLQCTFPKTVTNFKITARIRCSSGVPNDAVFFINPQFDNTKPGFLVPIRASACKAEFLELISYHWIPNIPAAETFFTIDVMWNSEAFAEQISFTPPGTQAFFQNLLNFNANTPIPAGESIWVDLMFADVSTIPVVPNIQFQGRRLYYVRNVFYLQIGGVRHVINEPIKWDDVKVFVIFDRKTKAFRFEFSDKDVLLKFDTQAGFDLLVEEKRTKGTNADVRLLFGEWNEIEEELTIHYEGQINFSEAEVDEFYFSANIERQSFGDKLRAFFDTNVDIFREMTLGGLVRPALTLHELFLHPRLLSFVANYKYNPTIPVDPPLIEEDSLIGGGAKVYVAYPPMKASSNNVDGLTNDVSPADMGTLVYAGLSLPAGVTSRKFFIEGGFSFKYTKTGSVQQPRAGFGIIKVPNISLGNTPEGMSIGPNVAGEPHYSTLNGILAGEYTVTGTFSGSIELKGDEALFIRATILNPVAGSPDAEYSDFEWLNPQTHYLIIKEQTVFAPSVVRVPLIHDVVNRELEIIVDKANPLKSNLMGRPDLGYAGFGCMSKVFMMNGKMIRELPNPAFPISAKGWFNPLDGLLCIGMSIERDSEEVESARVEELPYFFRNTLLINLEVISDYKTRPANEYLFNELSARFQKYPQDNQQDSLEDFMTQMDYVTPLKRIKNKLEMIIDAILSGNYIEYTRREGFKTNPTNAYDTDNNLFMIDAVESNPALIGATIIFNDDDDTITIMCDPILAVVAGDNITISNATGSVTNGTYAIQNVEIPFSYDRVILYIPTALPSNGSGTGDATVVDVNADPVVRWQAKRDEDFVQVTGVPFPKSVYNLRFHLKRVVLNWAKVFQAGWNFLITGLPTQNGIRFTDGKNNTTVRTEIDPGVACKFGDSQGQDRYDAGFESVNDMDAPLFAEDEISFRAPLTWVAFNFIRFAFEGRNPEGRDYGYIQFKNPDGEIEQGFCLKMEFDPNAQMCKFQLIKKYNA